MGRRPKIPLDDLLKDFPFYSAAELAQKYGVVRDVILRWGRRYNMAKIYVKKILNIEETVQQDIEEIYGLHNIRLNLYYLDNGNTTKIGNHISLLMEGHHTCIYMQEHWKAGHKFEIVLLGNNTPLSHYLRGQSNIYNGPNPIRLDYPPNIHRKFVRAFDEEKMIQEWLDDPRCKCRDLTELRNRLARYISSEFAISKG